MVRSFTRRGKSLTACIVIVGSLPLVGQALAIGSGIAMIDTTTTASTDPATVLVEAITREVKALPANASAEDIEAAITFAISQGNPPAAAIGEALNRLAGVDLGQPNAAQALKQVQLALLNKKLKRGTAALADYGRVTSSFSAPNVNVGGGTSNYSN